MPIVKRVPAFEGKGTTFIIENVLVDYASVFRPNTRYRPEWAVVVRVPQHLQQEFYEVGFRLKQDPNGNISLRAKRYVRLDNGEELTPPIVVDCDNNPWPENRGLIGNGSKCNVKVKAKYTTYQGVEGLSCYLEGLQVLEHIPYQGGVSFGQVQGNTGGYQQPSGFDQQHPSPPQYPTPEQQQPAPSPSHLHQQAMDPNQNSFQPPPAGHANPAAAHQQGTGEMPEWVPGQPPPVQPATPAQPAQPGQGFVPPPAQPSAFEAPQPPIHPAQGIPQGAPQGGNVSPPPMGALGSVPPQEPAHEEQQDYTPIPNNMGSDVPF